MTLSAIVAVSLNHAIGRKNQLPWHLPKDLKFFKQTTLGKPVLMGRKTYEALGKPLPGRTNIVVSSQQDLRLPEGVLQFADLGAGVAYLEQTGAEEGFIIGGGQIFAATMNQIDKLYITLIDTVIPDADTFFPEIDHSHWKLVSEERHEPDEKHAHAFRFQVFERIDL